MEKLGVEIGKVVDDDEEDVFDTEVSSESKKRRLSIENWKCKELDGTKHTELAAGWLLLAMTMSESGSLLTSSITDDIFGSVIIVSLHSLS